jgi:hypothetical protein
LPMAHDLVACCNGRADLLVLPARSHNEPFYNPKCTTGVPSSPGCSRRTRQAMEIPLAC